MNFVLIGHDRTATLFAAGACQRGDRLLAYVPLGPAPLPAELAPERTLDAVPAVSELAGVDVLVVSGPIAERAEVLRYVLRLDEIDLVLALPLADRPDVYYEVSLVAGETGIRVFPLLAERAHPALLRIRALLETESLGPARWLEWSLPLPDAREGPRWTAGWSWVRGIAGEIEQVTATASADAVDRARQVCVSARLAQDCLATVRYTAGAEHRFLVKTDAGRLDCQLPAGFEGAACLRWQSSDGAGEEAIDVEPIARRWLDESDRVRATRDTGPWLDALRQMELADAIDRSIDRGRAVPLSHEEVSEEASFKSVMTSLGCGLLWLTLVVAILAAAGVGGVQYLVLPALVVFLLLQFFGLIYRKPIAKSAGKEVEP